MHYQDVTTPHRDRHGFRAGLVIVRHLRGVGGGVGELDGGVLGEAGEVPEDGRDFEAERDELGVGALDLIVGGVGRGVEVEACGEAGDPRAVPVGVVDLDDLAWAVGAAGGVLDEALVVAAERRLESLGVGGIHVEEDAEGGEARGVHERGRGAGGGDGDGEALVGELGAELAGLGVEGDAAAAGGEAELARIKYGVPFSPLLSPPMRGSWLPSGIA